MLNRQIPPPLQEIKNYKLPIPNKYILDNGIPVYEMNTGTQDILKVELLFHSGRWFEEKALASKLTAALLREGTARVTGATIAEQIDFYGASLRFPSNLDTAHIQMYCLTKHLKNVLPVLEEILSKPAFPEKELQSISQRSKERLKIDLENNDTVAYRTVTELMYGKNHPYGYNSVPSLYDEIGRDDLVNHYQKNYVAGNCFVMVSGKTNKETISLINKHLGQVIPKGKSERKKFDFEPSEKRNLIVPKKDSLQTAIRISKRLFNREHADYQKMYILNTILGGYFGSRLMQNLREAKGYTYNIYSALDPMMMDGYFMVGTEARSEVAKETIKEIYSEFRRLRTELVPKEELDMVKNYLLGTLLTAVDGPFNASEVVKMILVNNLPSNYYSLLIDTIKDISSSDIQELANNYLQEDSFYEVIVG